MSKHFFFYPIFIGMVFIASLGFSQERSTLHKSTVARYQRKILEKESAWRFAERLQKDGTVIDVWTSGGKQIQIEIYDSKSPEEAAKTLQGRMNSSSDGARKTKIEGLGDEAYEKLSMSGSIIFYRQRNLVIVILPTIGKGEDASEIPKRFARYLADSIDGK